MKYYRRCCLFRRCRQHEQIFLRTAILLLVILSGLFLFNRSVISDELQAIFTETDISSVANCHCSQSSLVKFKQGECFFDQPVCYPGFVGKHCEIRVTNEVRRRTGIVSRCTCECRSFSLYFRVIDHIVLGMSIKRYGHLPCTQKRKINVQNLLLLNKHGISLVYFFASIIV